VYFVCLGLVVGCGGSNDSATTGGALKPTGEANPAGQLKQAGQAGKAGPTSTSRQYVTWTDPNERAFSVAVPQGWAVRGGCIRSADHLVATFEVEVRSPDQQVLLRHFRDKPGFIEANPPYFVEGTKTWGGGQIYYDVCRYCAGWQYVRQFALDNSPRDALTVTAERPWPDAQRVAAILPYAQLDVRELAYRFRRGTTQYQGAALTVTGHPLPPMGGPNLWHCAMLYLYEAPSDRLADAATAMLTFQQSMKVDPQWLASRIAATGRSSQILTELGESTFQIITSTYANRQAAEDRIFLGGSEARRGTVRVWDPVTREEQTVNTDPDSVYYWTNARGEIVGSRTADPPGPDLRPMVIVPAGAPGGQ
jgi:hypothetical protein